MKAVIKFTKDSPHYQTGESERIATDLVEIHYRYQSPLAEKSTAFERDGSGFTVENKYIESFEVYP